MIRKLKVYCSECFDPYFNLAVEQYLLETVEDGCCILYLWQNQNTVVIGRNQNAWKECRTTLLEKEGGHLARRLSGGGAVFHDLGNLNFTFLVPTMDYDLDRQLEVIITACRSLKIHAKRSGRNDILSDGKKFSGNAFYQNGSRSYHHGTLMVDSDMNRLGRYLTPSRAKLQAKGVDSVRSRVVNLRQLRPNVTIPLLTRQMIEAFEQVYGLHAEIMTLDDMDCAAIKKLYLRNRSWEWNYGRQLPFTFSCDEQFEWGNMQLQLQVENGIVRTAQVYSDAMDWQSAPELEKALIGCRFTLPDLQSAVQSCRSIVGTDISQMLARQNI
ncbi:MAG: lipoate--protein ligase [Clostridiales bacterium]|nr:lipoate--protein ligase [Candidatus Cacconaster stercorequi]